MKLEQPRRAARRVVDGFSRESELGWRWGRNLRPTLRYHSDGGPRQLTAGGRDAVENLRRDGVAVTDVRALTGSDDLLVAVQQQVEELLEVRTGELRARSAALAEGAVAAADKSYLVELLGLMPVVRRSDPIVRFVTDPRVRGVAEAYSAMRLRVFDFNAWYNLAVSGEATQSQRWHRDLPEDHDIVKVFLYVRDVPEGAGPLSYVTRSHTRSGRRIELPSTFDGIGYRIDDADVEAVGGGRIVSAPGPAGTVVFADTRGLHRGGWARTTDRLVVQGLYASRSCSRPGSLVPARTERREDLRDDFDVLSPARAIVRARALDVDLDALD